VDTPFWRSSCKRSQGVRSGSQSSSPAVPSGEAGKTSSREHQFNTGATRPRITGMAIIFSRLHDFFYLLSTIHAKASTRRNLLEPILVNSIKIWLPFDPSKKNLVKDDTSR
jgi:hypothetical protein